MHSFCHIYMQKASYVFLKKIICITMNSILLKTIKKYVPLAACVLFIAAILLFSGPALSASRRGLLLWFTTMLPTLLPYMIAINVLLYLLPEKSAYAKGFLLLGLLCGYPMGAKLCASLYQNGTLTKRQAQYYLPLINLPSPAYLISYVCRQSLSAGTQLFAYLLCIYASAAVYALLSYPFIKKPESDRVSPMSSFPEKEKGSAFFDRCILDAFVAITKLGGYIILFSILSALLLQLLTPFSELLSCLTAGILEITNGTEIIIGSGLSFYQKRLFILTITSFGGISCIFQTKSLLADTGISMTRYIFAKIRMAFLTALFVWLFI